MSIHEGFLELAAAAIDFDLDEYERAELDRHIDGCDACRRTAAAFRDDAAAIGSGAAPRLSPARSEAILAGALWPPKSSPPLRLLAIAALIAILGAGLGVAGMEYIRRSADPRVAVLPGPSDSSAPGPSSGPSARPTVAARSTPQPSGATPRPAGFLAAGTLPVGGSVESLGSPIRMAPGPDGALYVSIPARGGSVLALLDSTGRPRTGWPVVLAGTTSCELVLPVEDGSVRVLCTLENPDGNRFSGVRAFAVDPGGSLMAGWPIDLEALGANGFFAGRVIGDELKILAWESLGDQIAEGQPAGNAWIVTVAADGTVGAGAKVQYGAACCIDTWAVGPDGVAYGTIHHFADTLGGATSELAAVGPGGVPAGFPVAIDGLASEPAFDSAGWIHVTVGTPFPRPVRTLVFDPNGRAVNAGSGVLDIAATNDWKGAGGSFPAAPLVGADGTTFIIDDVEGTTVAGLSPSGRVIAGWPYRSDLGLEATGFCGPSDTGCGHFRAAPAIGPGNVLFLIHSAANPSAGGSIVAVGQDARVVAGWPVGLRRVGSAFWSVVVATDGTAYALAVEPEPNGAFSATILSLAPDSTVGYTATVVEP